MQRRRLALGCVAAHIGQCIDLTRITIDVDRKDGCRPWCDCCLNLIRVKSIIVRFDINKDRSDFVPKQRVGCCHKVNGW